MRRADREIKDSKRILEIMQKCDCCRLAFATNDVPYIVPMNFGISKDGKILYFHGSMVGRKYELIQKNDYIAFEMDCNHELVKSENPSKCSYLYSCIMGKGRISLISNDNEKLKALNSLMKHYYCEEQSWNYGKVIENTAVFKVEILEITCKEHK